MKRDRVNNMLSREITVVDELGLHVRPAALIASRAEGARSDVWIMAGAQTVDAKSVIAILMLGCKKGSIITVGVDDPMDSGILDNIESIFDKA